MVYCFNAVKMKNGSKQFGNDIANALEGVLQEEINKYEVFERISLSDVTSTLITKSEFIDYVNRAVIQEQESNSVFDSNPDPIYNYSRYAFCS